MILRTWSTGIDESRADEYESFAARRSRPMFEAQDGFAGLLLARADDRRLVLTMWRDRAAAEALARSVSYLETVAAIEAAGFLRPPQTVELFDVPDAPEAFGSTPRRGR